MSFQEVLNKITQNLQLQGFAVITSIDMRETFQKEIECQFPELSNTWSMQSAICLQGNRARIPHGCDAAL